MGRIWPALLLPLIFGAYPILALLATNASEMLISAGWRALVVALGTACLLWLVLSLLLKDWQRAAVLTALLLALFYSYGHVYGYLENNPLLGFSLGRHRTLAPLWLHTGL